jgi:hypothetical protein
MFRSTLQNQTIAQLAALNERTHSLIVSTTYQRAVHNFDEVNTMLADKTSHSSRVPLMITLLNGSTIKFGTTINDDTRLAWDYIRLDEALNYPVVGNATRALIQ